MTNNIYPIQIKTKITLDLITKVSWLCLLYIGIMVLIYIMVSDNKGILKMIIPTGIFLVLLIITLIQTCWDYFYLKSYQYECRKEIIYLKGGIISRFERNLPYSRVQHVIIYEPFWQRILGLSSISIETAHRHSQGISIPYLLKKDARLLKEQIISIASKYKPVAGI